MTIAKCHSLLNYCNQLCMWIQTTTTLNLCIIGDEYNTGYVDIKLCCTLDAHSIIRVLTNIQGWAM